MRHTCGMTMADLGPERPGQPSDTRQWGERGRTDAEAAAISTRRFFILLAILVVALVVFFVLR